MEKCLLLKHCVMLGLLACHVFGSRLDIPSLKPSKRCKVKGRTKCHYSLVVNEVSNKCPNLIQQAHNQQVKDKTPGGMQNEQPSMMSHLYLQNMEELQKKVQELETKLYSEMVKNRQLQTSSVLQEQAVNKVERSMEQQWGNVSTLITQLKDLHSSAERQKAHYKSIDDKLAGVMLDIVEINNVLNADHEGRSADTEVKKVIEVEAPSKVSACSISPNATKYRGKT